MPALSVGAAAAEVPFAVDHSGYKKIALPFMKEHCVSCHGAKKEKGDLNIEKQLSNNFLDLAETKIWGEIVDAVNSHEMPPEDEDQPNTDEAGKFADWVAGELGRAEVSQRSTKVILRRLNRAEYANTIRDLLGIDLNVEAFPEDAVAGGFDNIGSALTISPMQLELYYDTARKILDDVITRGEQAPMIKWRFEPEDDTTGRDRTRIEHDGQRIILNCGKLEKKDGMAVMRIDQWDRKINFRDFYMKHPGIYILRIRASSRVPNRDQVVKSARPFIIERVRKEAGKFKLPFDPAKIEKQIDHFRKDRMYDYGAARIKVAMKLGGQPRDIGEFEISSRQPAMETLEIPIFFDTQKGGITIFYAYSIPGALENAGFQKREKFARPEALIDWMELEGPIHKQWPPEPHARLFAGLPTDGDWKQGEARSVIARFMRKAWRRPVTDIEVGHKLALFTKTFAEENDFFEAIKAPLIAVLTSPHFLYIAEPSTGQRPLDGNEIATRLSYFLWSSMPDEELFALATSGKLTDPGHLGKQVDRLLADPKNSAFVDNFAGQWFDLRKIGANPPAADLFPRYDRHLEMSIAAESLGFFAEILNHDLDLRNFIRSDFVTINERLARFYNIPGVKGNHIRKVSVSPSSKRGGIITQASILSVTSNGTRTSPVVRGTWILKNILGTDPGLPVADVGDIQPKVPGIDKATVRQRLEIHRELAQCARCHNKIDPLGFALENFNAAGDWRDKEGFGYKGRIGKNDPDIDASAKMPDGTEFVGVSGLQKQLLKKEELFLRCISEKLFTYALGRELGYSDKPYIDASIKHLKAGDYTLRSLIHSIVTSEPFLSK